MLLLDSSLIDQARSFARKHETYCWFSIELGIVCGAAYSVPGLITAATGAMTAGNLWITLLEYLIAPLYAATLFLLVTGLITMIMIVPYAILFGQKSTKKKRPVKKATKRPAAAKAAEAKPAFRLRRKTVSA